ncbi:hypothetical protein BDQ17DRAFT_244271 [Cyathus striatus]|nr:hypothetical protein BDQ17DRAFT_244271 [Cyathus striatus]
MGSLSPSIVASVEHLNNTTYLHFATLALWVFEHLITMEMEVEYIWKSHWSVIKVLFIIVRYSTYGDIVLNVLVLLLLPQSASSCVAMTKAITWLLTVGMTLADLILTLRLSAILKKTKNMTIFLGIWYFSILIPTWVFTGFFVNSVSFDLQSLLQTNIFHVSCLPTGQRIELEAIPWACYWPTRQ